MPTQLNARSSALFASTKCNISRAETKEQSDEMRKFVPPTSKRTPLLLMRKGESIKFTSETFVTKLHLQTNTGNSSLTTGDFNCLSGSLVYSFTCHTEIQGSLLCSQLLLDVERKSQVRERGRERGRERERVDGDVYVLTLTGSIDCLCFHLGPYCVEKKDEQGSANCTDSRSPRE